jgi:hypothetical protein
MTILRDREAGADESQEVVKPTAQWRLDYFEKGKYFAVFDEKGEPQKWIRGQDARILRRILTSQNQHIPEDAINAFRPLLARAFPREFDMDEQGEAYRLELVEKQPRQHPRESEEEVYKRMWTGTLMPGEISAEELADRIVKGEQRVKVAVAWGDISQTELGDRIWDLAEIIREYHPQGPRGR